MHHFVMFFINVSQDFFRKVMIHKDTITITSTMVSLKNMQKQIQTLGFFGLGLPDGDGVEENSGWQEALGDNRR